MVASSCVGMRDILKAVRNDELDKALDMPGRKAKSETNSLRTWGIGKCELVTAGETV
ncbi:hypothetical protein ACNQ6O_14990 [Marinobacter sp. SBS5]|uniref:hypothetical protein n=1 Tax=Marinobacter sp. SBS5 TaxID=3401754 RepID=UPI003AB0FD90